MASNSRKNGYYFYKDRWLPSVSTILKSAGSSEGLIKWGAKQGGLGVIWGLSKIKDAQALSEKLGSPSCIEWAAESALAGLEAEGNRVKDFGSRVHHGIECRLKHTDIDLFDWNDEEKTALESFDNFYANVGFYPISIETTVYSGEYGFAGRLDLVAEINESQAEKLRPYLMKSSPDIQSGLLISDFKTGSLYVQSQSVQLAAYAEAYKETYDRQCTGGLLINIERENPERVRCYYIPKCDLKDAFSFGFLPAYHTWMWFDAPKWWKHQEEDLKEFEKIKAVGGVL